MLSWVDHEKSFITLGGGGGGSNFDCLTYIPIKVTGACLNDSQTVHWDHN